MKTLEERAKEYARIKIDYSTSDQSEDGIYAVTTLFDKRIYDAYITGAEAKYEEMTCWRDPKNDLPERNVDVLVKLRDTYRDNRIHYSVGYINGACWFGDSIGTTDEVIGWSPISE